MCFHSDITRKRLISRDRHRNGHAFAGIANNDLLSAASMYQSQVGESLLECREFRLACGYMPLSGMDILLFKNPMQVLDCMCFYECFQIVFTDGACSLRLEITPGFKFHLTRNSLLVVINADQFTSLEWTSLLNHISEVFPMFEVRQQSSHQLQALTKQDVLGPQLTCASGLMRQSTSLG